MQAFRILSVMILIISIVFLLGNSSADDPEFDFRFDEPDDGIGSVDPESTIELRVAIENYLTLQEVRRHERVDRQLSIGAEIQAQLLPDHCPVIEGIELAALCRPAFQVGGDYYDFMPTRPELIG